MQPKLIISCFIAGSMPKETTGAPKKIIIADDNLRIRNLTVCMLKDICREEEKN